MNRYLLKWWINSESGHLTDFTVRQVRSVTPRDLAFELSNRATRYYLYLSYREEAPFIAFSSDFPPSEILSDLTPIDSAFAKSADHQLENSRLKRIYMPEDALRLVILEFEHLSEYGVVTQKQVIAELAGRASQIALISPKGYAISYAKQVHKPLPGGRRFTTGKPFPFPTVQPKPLAPSFGIPDLISLEGKPVIAREWLLGFSGWDRDLSKRVLEFHGFDPQLELANNASALTELKVIVQALNDDPSRIWLYYSSEQDITANELVWTWLVQQYQQKEIRTTTSKGIAKPRVADSPLQAILRKYGVSANEYTLSDGFVAVRGTSDKSNDELVRRLHSGEHLWFHANDYPGSHVILIVDKKQKVPSDKVIREAALIAGYFSKGNPKRGLGHDAKHEVDIAMCPIKLLKRFKHAKPGQVLLPKQFKVITVELEEFAALKKQWHFTESFDSEKE